MTKNIDELLSLTFQTNEDNGYNEYADELDVSAKAANKHLGNKGLLVVSEIAEAQDELRHGHAPYEVYEVDGKPEGYLVELADALIRILGDAGEVFAAHPEMLASTSFGAIVEEKLAYNARRADTAKSGVKAF